MSSNNEASDVVDELDYLTIIPLHEEEETYHIRPCFGKVEMFGGVYTQLAPLYYRINNGEWIEVMLPDDEYDILFYINLKKGDELQLKCTTYDLNPNDYYEFYYVVLNTSARFNVRGTPMSLVYGDDFKENNVAVEGAISELFYGDEGLTEILNPKTFLPCTVLERYCYSQMFYNCTNLVNAPELPATTLAEACYSQMFYNCTKLNYIKMLATDISATDCLACWVEGVSSTGTFVKNKDATWDVVGVSGIPEGWTVKTDDEESGGNDFGIEFPLYLEFDWCEGDDISKYCQRDADELGLNLYQYLAEIAIKYGEQTGHGYFVSEQILNMIGFELYIEGEKVVNCYYSTNLSLDPSYFSTNGVIGSFSIRESGEIDADVFG